jgi:2,3-bisphosphoglycerate-independent phosphoglycerate mutase
MVATHSSRPRFLLLFVDGIGLVPAAATNPFATVPTPALAAALGGSLTLERLGRAPGLLVAALDATLGVPGLPQSATGQTALFTGENAPALLGRHVAAFPGPRLAALLAEQSLLKRARDRGHAVTFVNPFTPAYFAEVAAGRRRHSATTLAALASGARFRDADDLRAGRAVPWDVTGAFFRAFETGIEEVAPETAGAHLAQIAAENELTLWETFMTDLAGHGRRGWSAEEALARLDGLVAGLVAHRAADVTLLLTSDHGNLEESHHTSHTRNPVPLLALGPHAEAFDGLKRIDEIAPRILELLE